MNARTALLFLCAAVAAGALVHCGGDGSPTQNPTTVPTVPVTTTTTQPAGIVLPPGMVCSPTPPPLYRMQPSIQAARGDGWRLDSKPVVVNTPDDYCGKYAGRSGRFCDTRPEGDPQRTACDYLATGQATDTGRWGPTWTVDGRKCDPPGTTNSSNPCLNHPDNQFLVIAKGGGLFEACASPLAKVDPDGERCGQVSVK